jgi:hypothetical protein
VASFVDFSSSERFVPGVRSQFDFSPMSVMLAGVLVVVQMFVAPLSQVTKKTPGVCRESHHSA